MPCTAKPVRFVSYAEAQMISRHLHTPSAEYGFPMDAQELERLDICHIKYFALLEKRHFLSPIDDKLNPQRILDLGCGTGRHQVIPSLDAGFHSYKRGAGAWCIDVADRFPSAIVSTARHYTGEADAEQKLGRRGRQSSDTT